MTQAPTEPAQLGLFDAEPELQTPAELRMPAGGYGRVERGLVDAAISTGLDKDLGKRAALLGAMAGARALDVAELSRNPYATAQLIKAYLEQLQALGLAEPLDGGDDDPFAGLG